MLPIDPNLPIAVPATPLVQDGDGSGRTLPDKAVKAADPVKRVGMGGGSAGFGQFPGFLNALPFRNPWISMPYLAWLLRWDPTLNHVFENVCGPVRTAARSIDVISLTDGKGDLDTVKLAAERALLPIFARAVPGALEATAFGCMPQEVVWGRCDGRIDPLRVLPILPGEGVLHSDEYRSLTGVEINGQWLDARYIFHAVHNAHIHPVLGRGNNEAAYAAWHRGQQSDLNADRVERKVSGVQFALLIAAGAVPLDSNGNPIDPVKFGQQLLGGMKNGESVVFEKWAFEKDVIQAHPELNEIQPIDFKLIDFGDLGPAIQAHLKRMDRTDIEKWRAWGVSERALAEASNHGGFADAKVHTAAIGPLSDQLHLQYLDQFNEQVVARWVQANYGDDPGFQVRIVPTQETDEDLASAALELVTTLATNTNTNPAITANLDERKLLEMAGMPLLSETDAAKKLADIIAQKQQADAAKLKQLQAGQQKQGQQQPELEEETGK